MENKEISNIPDDPFPFSEDEAGTYPVETSEIPPMDYEEPCELHCRTVDDFLRLTDTMISDIISLEEELVRWRQVLIKYLPERWADGLRQDIFCNMTRAYEGDPAYDLYVQCRGSDPQQSWEHAEYMQRLANGTDETSITYL